MSTASIVAIPKQPIRKEQDAPAPQRRLRAVPRPTVRRGARVAHGVVALAGLGIVIGAQLAMSAVLNQGAYELQTLQSSSSSLNRDAQALQEQLDILQSPQHVAMAAEALGMVEGPGTQFLQLSNGQVLGGPDALHMESSAVNAGGQLYVGSELVQPAGEPAATAEAEAPAEYPGMLLPAEGVATGE